MRSMIELSYINICQCIVDIVHSNTYQQVQHNLFYYIYQLSADLNKKKIYLNKNNINHSEQFILNNRKYLKKKMQVDILGYLIAIFVAAGGIFGYYKAGKMQWNFNASFHQI